MSGTTDHALDAEDVIPSVARRRATPKPALRIVLFVAGVLAFGSAVSFVVHRLRSAPADERGAEAVPDVASARNAGLRMPEIPPVAPVPAPPAAPIIVPKIETGPTAAAAPIPMRDAPARKTVAPEDAPIFAGSVSPSAGSGASNAANPHAGPVAEAEASLDRYRRQLDDAMKQLQGSKPSVPNDVVAPGGAGAMPSPGGFSGPLFGSMERSVTPRTSARTLGNASLILPKGTLFTCSLKTKVVTSSSGFVGCQTLRNVYGDDGKVVLAERGSHLDGEYRIVQVRPGLTRVPVLWTRLRTPAGVTVDLDSPATGELGESGLGGYVDNRWGERIGGALLLSLIDDSIKIAISDGDRGGSGSNTVVLPNTAAQGSKLAEQVLASTINIPPLLYRNQGGVVGVYVARDVDFASVYELKAP